MRPTAFRIYDFKSILDSGECEFSADNITVLAGQNESGKTAILTALRDFDLEISETPETPEYRPDNRFDAAPRVAVKFEFILDEIRQWLTAANANVPEIVLQSLAREQDFWITRDLDSGELSFAPSIAKLWDLPNGENVNSEEAEEKSEEEKEEEDDDAEEEEDVPSMLSASEFIALLHEHWPAFIYFDSFGDTLPRFVEFDALRPRPSKPSSATSIPTTRTKTPQPVLDFITLADIDLLKIDMFSSENKLLSNYLSSREARITDEFLTYWKQRVDEDESMSLKVKHVRDEEGKLCLEFYVHDKFDQYPEQRSKGFLWFLSFYLRLAAPQHRLNEKMSSRVLLIDEPGTYLHARAQRDVLDLFQSKLAPRDSILYSTHSPYLLPADKLHRLRVVLKTSSEGTVVLDRLTHPLLRKDEFSDTMSPILSAIGLDITDALKFVHSKNVILEGISDHYYIAAWDKQCGTKLLTMCNLFPAAGALSTVTLASLFIGWGLHFIVVLDRDKQGDAAKEKLIQKLGVRPDNVVQPAQAKNIEDLFSFEDFKSLIKSQDNSLTIETGETPTKAVERQNIDKVVIARKYAESVFAGKITLTQKSSENIKKFLENIKERLDIPFAKEVAEGK